MTLRPLIFIALAALLSGACHKEADPKSSEKTLYKVALSDPSGLQEYANHDSTFSFIICPAYYGNLGINDLHQLTTQLEVSAGATVEGYQDGIRYDYSEPVNLHVIAEDGSDTTYTIRVGYIDGGWYQNDTPAARMKVHTATVWAAREISQHNFKFTFAARTEIGPVAFSLNIGNGWNMPDSIAAPVTFTNVQATFYKETDWLNAIQSKLIITEFNRQTREISGQWDIRFSSGTDTSFNRSKGQFQHFPLN